MHLIAGGKLHESKCHSCVDVWGHLQAASAREMVLDWIYYLHYNGVPMTTLIHHSVLSFVDTCMHLWLCSAARIFNATADTLERKIVNEGMTVIEFIIPIFIRP